MAETIRQTVARINDDPELTPLNALNEQQVKVGIIEPLLQIAGWDRRKIQTEFVPEYKIGNEEVDYALRIDSSNRVFVEAKNARVDLHGQPTEQLLNYCRSAEDSPDIAVLTNGRLWWLYSASPDKQGGWQKPRQFCTIDIESDKPGEVQDRFKRFLFKDKYAGGSSALNAAWREYGKLVRDAETQKAIFAAWNRIVNSPEEGLINLITDVTEDICGHNPAPTTIRVFLKEHNFTVSAEPHFAEQASDSSKFSPTNKEVRHITFLDASHSAKSWRGVFTTLCELIYEDRLDNGDFDKVLTLRGSKQSYFAKYGEGLRNPRQIKSSDIFLELHQVNSEVAVTRCEKILNLFEYKLGDLIIEARDKNPPRACISVSLPRG